MYTVKLRAKAHKDLKRLPREVHARVLDQLISLQEEPRPRGVEKLSGKKVGGLESEIIASFTKSTINLRK